MRQWTMGMLTGCALLGTVACGSNSNDQAAMGTSSQPAAVAGDTVERRDTNAGSQQVTLTGCLQRGGGALTRGFMLTMLNEPSGSVGTSGNSVTQSGSSVEREQMRMAARTYRLEPKGEVDLDPMVGKQVRVTGVVVEAADVPKGNAPIGSDADTQRPNRDRNDREAVGARMDTSDLAKVEISAASIVAEACGGRDNGQPSGVGAGRSGAVSSPLQNGPDSAPGAGAGSVGTTPSRER